MFRVGEQEPDFRAVNKAWCVYGGGNIAQEPPARLRSPQPQKGPDSKLYAAEQHTPGSKELKEEGQGCCKWLRIQSCGLRGQERFGSNRVICLDPGATS